MIKNNLEAPPIHPAAPTTPVDANHNPIYSNPEYYKTNGCIGIDGQSPISIAQTISLVQLTKTIQQLSDLSKHASIVFEDLNQQMAQTFQRWGSLRARIQNMKGIINLVENKMVERAEIGELGNERPEWKATVHIDQTLFIPETQHPIVDQVYQSCFETPPLYILDGFREDGNTCMRQYSYPQFFMEQWKSVMMREQEERRKKKNEKKLVDKTKKEAVKVSDVKVKRYNKFGELIVSHDELRKDHDTTTSAVVPTNPEVPQMTPQQSQAFGYPMQQSYGSMPWMSQQTPKGSEPALTQPNMSVSPSGQPTGSGSSLDNPVPMPVKVMMSKGTEQGSMPLHMPIQKEVQGSIHQHGQQPAHFVAPVIDQHFVSAHQFAAEPKVDQTTNSIALSATGLPETALTLHNARSTDIPLPPAPPPAPMTPLVGSYAELSPSPAKEPSEAPQETQPSRLVTTEALQSVVLKKAPQVERSPTDPRMDMLKSIRHKEFSLRKVQIEGQKSINKKGSSNDVATILMRRVALEMSDSDESAGEPEEANENDWD